MQHYLTNHTYELKQWLNNHFTIFYTIFFIVIVLQQSTSLLSSVSSHSLVYMWLVLVTVIFACFFSAAQKKLTRKCLNSWQSYVASRKEKSGARKTALTYHQNHVLRWVITIAKVVEILCPTCPIFVNYGSTFPVNLTPPQSFGMWKWFQSYLSYYFLLCLTLQGSFILKSLFGSSVCRFVSLLAKNYVNLRSILFPYLKGLN